METAIFLAIVCVAVVAVPFWLNRIKKHSACVPVEVAVALADRETQEQVAAELTRGTFEIEAEGAASVLARSGQDPEPAPGRAGESPAATTPTPTPAYTDLVSSTLAKELCKSALMARQYLDEGRDSVALEFGRMLHLAVLEPEKYRRKVLVVDPDIEVDPSELRDVVIFDGERRTKAGRAAYAQLVADNKGATIIKAGDQTALNKAARAQLLTDHPGATVIKPGKDRLLKQMVARLKAHPLAGPLLFGGTDGRNEVPIEWVHPRTGHRCRTHLDRLVTLDGKRILVDLKGMSGISPGQFSASIAKYGYDVQFSFCADGCSCSGNHVDEVKLAAIDKAPPHEIAVYNLTEDKILAPGRFKYENGLDLLEECAKSGYWPGAYEDEEIDINMPRWAMETEDDELEDY
jgi:hypothetical protein